MVSDGVDGFNIAIGLVGRDLENDRFVIIILGFSVFIKEREPNER